MTLPDSDTVNVTQALPSFAACLADSTYAIVLRHGISGSWIDLQLELFRVLAAAVAKNERVALRSPSAVEYLACREMFLSELTDAAYRTALRYGLQGSFLDVELELDLALRNVIEQSRSSSVPRLGLGASAREIAYELLARFERAL